MHLLAFPYVGPTELLVILVVTLLVFGKNLPSVMRSLGSSVNEFKKGLNDAAPEAAPAAPVQEQALPSAPVAKQLP